MDFVENTLGAFESAVEKNKYKFIEFDIQYTKDKIIVVYHDDSLSRLQKKPNRIEDLTYEEILEISDYHIPTYKEVMDLISGKKPLNIEIKSQGNQKDDEKLADFIISDLKNKGVLESTLISSSSVDLLFYINKTYDDGYKKWFENRELCLKEQLPLCDWEKNIKINTGLVRYITSDTFSQPIGFKSPAIFKMKENGINYFMLHASNIKSYDSLKKYLPKNIHLCFWYFSDEVYVMIQEN